MSAIYMDNAATSFPKPEGVSSSMKTYMDEVGATINRSVYGAAQDAGLTTLLLREAAAKLFHFPEPATHVILTPGATASLNMVIKGLLKPGDHCIVSSMEHNAVMRPLLQLEGVSFDRIPCSAEGLLNPADVAVLVVPIDKAAPKGRLILPQQQTIRDILEAGASALVCRDTELTQTLARLAAPPKLVITDSQVFGKVSQLVPAEIPLTSFSILMARYKGDLPLVVSGAAAVETLQDGDRVLICEGCTHHRQCDDIGTVKLPRWFREYTGASLQFDFTSGTEFPEDLSPYRLVVHCGACMLNQREVTYRLRCCQDQGVPVTNYGILIAYFNGILKRTVAPFPDVAKLLP